MISRLREPFNSISHFLGAAAALAGGVTLLTFSRGEPAKIAAILAYSVCLFGLFFSSGLYHGVTTGPKNVQLLRKVDHSAIYLLIAGTYTPFCVIALRGFWQWGLLALIWSLALAGVISKLTIANTPRWLNTLLYIIMGWISILAAGEMTARLSPITFGWLLCGGILYTLGAGVYVSKKGSFLPGFLGFHEVWHIFVLLGAAAHFIAVALLL